MYYGTLLCLEENICRTKEDFDLISDLDQLIVLEFPLDGFSEVDNNVHGVVFTSKKMLIFAFELYTTCNEEGIVLMTDGTQSNFFHSLLNKNFFKKSFHFLKQKNRKKNCTLYFTINYAEIILQKLLLMNMCMTFGRDVQTHL